MIAFSRVFLSFISAFSDNNLGNCTEIPVVAKHRIYQSVAPFLSPKIPPWIGRRRRVRRAAPSPQPSHRVYLSKSALWQCVGIRTEGYFSFTHNTGKKNFCEWHPLSKQIYILTILILRLPLSLSSVEKCSHICRIQVVCCARLLLPKTSQKEQKKARKVKERKETKLSTYEAFPPVTSRRIASSFTDDKTIIWYYMIVKIMMILRDT